MFFSESQGEKLAQLLAGLPSGKKAESVKLKCSSEQARLTAVYCSIAFQKETEGEKMSHEKVRMAVKGSK